MGIRAALLSFALFLVAVVSLGSTTHQTGAATLFDNQNVASSTYYTLDTETGVVQVRVEATVLNASLKEQPTVYLVAMPGAQDIVVTRDGIPMALSTELRGIKIGQEVTDPVTVVTATLDRPLLDNARDDFEMTYSVGAVDGENLTIGPGAILGQFVSQGPQSFVFFDVEADGQSFFDAGCLLAGDQPAQVQDAGQVRWVCGDAFRIGLNLDNAAVLSDCAGLDDRCRQAAVSPFAAYAQSITDPSKQGVLEGPVTMPDGRIVTLRLDYLRTDQAWAERQFDVAVAALPALESLFGYPYPFDSLTMLQSHHIETVGAAGIAFSKTGEVLLAEGSGVDEEVTIHELAHQWAGNQLETSWLWEGQADWATQVVAPQIGVSTRDWGWQALGYTDVLSRWHNGSLVTDAYYWYGKSAAFWFEFERAIGGRANMTAVLSAVDDSQERWPLDGRFFQDEGERVSGANLDELFLTWVYDRTTAAPLLAERRAVYNDLGALSVRATVLFAGTGMPTDIEENLLIWSFGAASADIAEANRVLDRYEEAITLAAGVGLVSPATLAESWGTSTVAQSSELVGQQLNAVNSIINATANLAGEDLDSPSTQRLSDARDAYEAGDFVEATELASGSVANAVNSVAAGRMIEKAKDRQATFDPSLIEKIGLFLKDPGGDLEKAEAALADGDGTQALELATSAYNTWGSAQSSGIFRLSALMAINCLVFAGVWMLLKRVDMSRNKPVTVQKSPTKKPGTKPTVDPGRKTQA